MKVKTIEVFIANNVNARNIYERRDLSRLLFASLVKPTLPKGESKVYESYIALVNQFCFVFN